MRRDYGRISPVERGTMLAVLAVRIDGNSSPSVNPAELAKVTELIPAAIGELALYDSPGEVIDDKKD